MYLVKKYRNRKLYLPASTIEDKKVSGRYITSYQLLELDKEKGVKVINDQTKEDITDETLLSAIFEFAKEDLILRDSLISAFRKDESLLPRPCFLLEAVNTVKKTEATPTLNIKEKDAIETTATETPVIETPVIENPVIENPVVETPVAEKSEVFNGF